MIPQAEITGPGAGAQAEAGTATLPRRKHAREYKLTVASKLDNLAKIGNFVAETCAQLRLPPELAFDVQVAIEEASTNIIQHAYNQKPDRPIVLGMRLRNQDLIVRIRDFGQPFVPDSIPSPKLDVRLEERRPGGLGLYLIKRLMNRVKFRSDEHRGNELTMVKRVPVPANPGLPEGGSAGPDSASGLQSAS